MPQPFNNAVMTNNGAALLTKAQAGECSIEFTKMAIGNGTYSASEETVDALQQRTALKSQKNSYAVNSIQVYTEKTVKVTALITNQDPNTGESLITDGYYINEIGLFAKEKNGAASSEVLYSIATTTGDQGDFMPPYNGYNPAQITQDYYATVDNSANVTIDTSGAVLTVEEANKKFEVYDEGITYSEEANDYIYEGRDLTSVFADEIGGYADEWAWIQARIKAGDFSGLRNGDYIPLVVDGYTYQMQINIDCYYRTGDETALGHHIDFISREVIPDTVAWNETNNNNGNAEESSPWLCSNLYDWLNTTVWEEIPDNVKQYIKNKRTLIEERYSADGALTESTGRKWADIGNLWVPSAWEVFASYGYGTPVYSEGQNIQYPIFAHSYKNRIKTTPGNTARRGWWLLSVRSGNSTYACHVNSHGTSGHYATSYANRAPLCFRIAAN